jgi:hypothetical protein
MPRKRSVVAVANEMISFAQAARWAGVSSVSRERGMKAVCPSCGEADALYVYPDHGWCFGEQAYFSAVGLLARAWRMDREDAAVAALDRIGYVPASHAHLWERAEREPDPDRGLLDAALGTWCEAQCGDWAVRQYDPVVARQRARCLGLLHKVRTADDCDLWLESCKTVMGRVLPRH